MKDPRLGRKGIDKVTQYEGTIVSVIEYITGCKQLGICSTIGADRKMPVTEYFDETRVDIMGDTLILPNILTDLTETGGAQRDCPKQ